jgi:hypothetical protein
MADTPGKDPWEDFRAHRPERRPHAGRSGFLLALILFVVVGAGIGGAVGAVWNPGPRSTRMDRLARTTTSDMARRAAIGAAIGAVGGVLFVFRSWRSRE